LPKAGLLEHRLGAEEREVVVHPLATEPRVGLDGGCAAFSGVFDGRADHRDRDALPAVSPAHGDARDDPRRDVVDRRRRLRMLDARVVVARTQRDEPNRLPIPIRHQAG
jgi:hypothetical protein